MTAHELLHNALWLMIGFACGLAWAIRLWGKRA